MEIKKLSIVVIQLLIGIFLVGLAPIQEMPYRINIQKDFGFNSGNRIRGTFSLAIIGKLEHIDTVTFMLDGRAFSKTSVEPYQYQFKTQDYLLGMHEFSAVVEMQDGSTVTTPSRFLEFVSAEDESTELQGIVFPLFGGIILLVIAIFLVQWLIFRDKNQVNLPYGAPRHYGILGGTICPKCQRPFSIHWWSINLAFHKYDRCDYCSRWSVVRRKPKEELAEAEAAELVHSRKIKEISTLADHTHEMDRLDATRYFDNE